MNYWKKSSSFGIESVLSTFVGAGLGPGRKKSLFPRKVLVVLTVGNLERGIGTAILKRSTSSTLRLSGCLKPLNCCDEVEYWMFDDSSAKGRVFCMSAWYILTLPTLIFVVN